MKHVSRCKSKFNLVDEKLINEVICPGAVSTVSDPLPEDWKRWSRDRKLEYLKSFLNAEVAVSLVTSGYWESD